MLLKSIRDPISKIMNDLRIAEMADRWDENVYERHAADDHGTGTPPFGSAPVLFMYYDSIIIR